MTPKEKLAAAEKALKDLEKFRHDFENTRSTLIRAQQGGDAKEIATAQAAHDAATKLRDGAKHTEQDIHKAAQAVLDARAEVETEGKPKT